MTVTSAPTPRKLTNPTANNCLAPGLARAYSSSGIATRLLKKIISEESNVLVLI